MKAKKRFELVIFKRLTPNKVDFLKNENIGTVYIYVDKSTISSVRETLINCNYTTRIFVAIIDNKNYFYIYGKKKKNKGVFNEHCKNSVYNYDNFENFYSHIIKVSSNDNDNILLDKKDKINITLNREINFYNE